MSTLPQSGPLSGQVALVTGVSRRQGIGAALTRRLLAEVHNHEGGFRRWARIQVSD